MTHKEVTLTSQIQTSSFPVVLIFPQRILCFLMVNKPVQPDDNSSLSLECKCHVFRDGETVRHRPPTAPLSESETGRLMPLYLYHSSFPGGGDGKASACNVRDPGSIAGSGRSPGEGSGNPLQYSLLGKVHGWRSLVGYSPWGRKESDTTE